MADYSRTRTSEASLMASIKTLLDAYTSWTVKEYAYDSGFDTLFEDYLYSTATVPACILVHTGSKTNNNENAAVVHTFSVFVVHRSLASHSTAIDNVQALVEKVYELLDNQIINTSTVWLTVTGYSPMGFKNNANLVAYKVDIQAEDN